MVVIFITGQDTLSEIAEPTQEKSQETIEPCARVFIGLFHATQKGKVTYRVVTLDTLLRVWLGVFKGLTITRAEGI
jgi:hypothetical protein